MSNGIWILIIFFLALGFIIYTMRQGNKYEELYKSKFKLVNSNEDLIAEIARLKKNSEYLQRVKIADENIFDYIRCINIPRSPACKGVEDGESNICRSRQIDCNKYKLVLENDPIAIERTKIATDQYVQTGKPSNPSDLTYPVRSGWYF